MKTTRKFLKDLPRDRKAGLFNVFINMIFYHTVGNPELDKEQQRLLNFVFSKIWNTEDMSVKAAVRIARWINTQAGEYRENEGDVFERVPV